MDRKSFLWSLNQALSELVPTREREEMIRYYEEYFDEAGPEHEAETVESLGDPRELAKKLAVEAGFSGEKPVRKKRRGGSSVLIAVVAVIAVAVVALGYLVLQVVDKMVDFNFPSVVTTQSTEPMDPQSSAGQIADVVKEFRSIDVEVPLADVTVIVGENYGVELVWPKDGGYSLKSSVSNGLLKVTASHKTLNGLTVEGASVVITVPAGAELSEINVETGLGSIHLSGVKVRDVDCDTGSGSVIFEQLHATEITADAGMGDVIWNGSLAADMELNTGMGSIEIAVGSVDGWIIELETGMGEVIVNGEDEGSAYWLSGTSGELEASTGMGDITLDYGG